MSPSCRPTPRGFFDYEREENRLLGIFNMKPIRFSLHSKKNPLYLPFVIGKQIESQAELAEEKPESGMPLPPLQQHGLKYQSVGIRRSLLFPQHRSLQARQKLLFLKVAEGRTQSTASSAKLGPLLPRKGRKAQAYQRYRSGQY